MKLSSQQQKAVDFEGAPTLVISGAGSGKTTVLTNKIVRLIEKGYDSERILAITFTNKAADEMKSRLVELTGLPIQNFPWVRTYHSACFRILRVRCPLLGYSTPLQIYAGYQQQKLIKDIILGMNFDKKHVPAVLSHISRAKNSGNPLRYFERKPRVSHIRLIDVYNRYENELRAQNAVDFDNILVLTRDLFQKHQEVREFYQSLFQYVLCDEYQDTNPLQAILTDLFVRNGNLFCVGDDWQSIYRFRGSDIDQFLSFPKKYKNAKIFRLEQNYRSADEIVQIANDLIQHNPYKMEKKCFSRKRGGTVELHRFYDEDEEARWVGRKIQSLVALGIPYERMAVLYRTKFCSLPFEKTLRNFDIPYQMMGSKGFFERKEIMDINCYLKSAIFPKDDASFDRIINTPRRGIGPGTLKKIAQVRTKGMSLQDATRKVLAERMMSPKIHKTLTHLIQVLDEIKAEPSDMAIHKVLSQFGYLQYLEKYSKSNSTDYDARKENIDELIYTASKKQNLLDYLEEVDLIREDKDNEEAEEDYDTGVKLSTVHASKGLEYYVVFIVGCEEDLFPHWKSKDSDMDLQEERRLMYVAVTRAEKYLFVSHSQFRRGQSCRVSRFWKEIRESLSLS